LRIKRLNLKNFRNISDCVFEPAPGLNFLLGQNGQGKTSILEAIGFLATLRSFRGSKVPEVIQWGHHASEVVGELVPESDQQDWKVDLKLTFLVDPTSERASKTAFINGKAYKSSTQYLSQRFGNFELGFHSVVFNPSDHDLVRDEPATRRAYLDRVISAEDVEYLKALQKYQRVLDQRNALLKTYETPRPDLLRNFTEPLAQLGAYLTYKRLEWILKLSERLNETAHHIAPKQSFLRLVYLSNWAPEIDNLSLNNKTLSLPHFTGLAALPSLQLLELTFLEKQAQVAAAEWKSGHSLIGPHRDDWTFFLGEQVLKGHGSQGEVRSALLALKLCEIELFRMTTGHRPVFLLDDFSSELDRERRAFLLDFLSEKDLQVFVTTTDESVVVGKQHIVAAGGIHGR
jgi:DNA replication and repair protein RecF